MNRKTDTIPKQPLTIVGKVTVKSDSMALLLGLLGFSATKLWNAALWHCKEQWDAAGTIPSYTSVDRHLKTSGNGWYRGLHAQSSQAVLEELWQSYRSWFALRKKGDARAKPPGFRRKENLSTVTFKRDSLRWGSTTRTLRVGIPEAVFGHRYLHLPLELPPGRGIRHDDIQVVRLVHAEGEWFVHLVCDIPVPETLDTGHTLAIDLGINVIAATACTDGGAGIWSGGELSSLERYFEKEKTRCTDSRSRKNRNLNRKRSRQRAHFLHSMTRTIVNDAHARGVTKILLGDLKDMRTGTTGGTMDWGNAGNQALHKWPYRRIIGMIRYKARLLGISVELVSERYTSQDCSHCSTRRKASRVHRGLYSCPVCGSVIHADVNGAINILQRYLPEINLSWSSGCLAQPVVNRFAWREPRPSVREPGTWWRNTPPHPQTQSLPLVA